MGSSPAALLKTLADGGAIADEQLRSLSSVELGPGLLEVAGMLRDRGHGTTITYSPKVFIPLTKLCRNVCHYCVFAHPPRRGERCYLTPDEVMAIARQGVDAGCREALFTLGDKPERRYPAARRELDALGHDSTLSYLSAMAALVRDETGLLPHLNPGVMSSEELAELRGCAASMGLMLESSARHLMERGQAHHGSPDKDPAARLATIDAAGALNIPFTSGLLVGIGESRADRIDTLVAIQRSHRRHGHIQEVIVQNFLAKPGTRMAGHADVSEVEHLWTIAIARLILGPSMSIQAPPNLAKGALSKLIAAGINDWGGVSPVTPDHVNPERPWPTLDALRDGTERAGKTLVPRLTLYPSYARDLEKWADRRIVPHILRASDTAGLAREDGWISGRSLSPPPVAPALLSSSPAIDRLLARAHRGERLDADDIVPLFAARGGAVQSICDAADTLRARECGDDVTYVVNRNINYTNICSYRCAFCAFSKGHADGIARDRPYRIDLDEIGTRVAEAWARGATEVCMQGGIHPAYSGETYLAIARAAKQAAPRIHVHAFSPLEIWHGATSLNRPIGDYLRMLRDAGLDTLPGTAAEILDDAVRRTICPDKIDAGQWLDIVAEAHRAGLGTTATIMFGHVDNYAHWARHLLSIRDLQAETGGFTEFVPLPFVAGEAPIYRRGQSRAGPTWRESLLMHAVARLVLNPLIVNIQASWVKLGPAGAAAVLKAGANDLGGTLMNESITRAAGAAHGQEFTAAEMEGLIRANGRVPRQRRTDYRPIVRAAAYDPASELSRTFGNRDIRVG